MKKKILTLDDLIQFCQTQNLTHFDAQESGFSLAVRTMYAIDADSFAQEDENDLILYGKVKLLHTGRNRNGSNVTKKAAEQSMSKIQYKPVLANFYVDDEGVKDFTSHDMVIDDEGEITYLEHQVGCFTADKPTLEYDEENDRYYIYATVAIPREYTDAAEIIERKQGTKVSAELIVNKMSYDAKQKELLLEDIEVSGVTLLGKNPDTGKDVVEGMEGAKLDIIDFSAESGTILYDVNDKLVEILDKLNNTLSDFNIQNIAGKEVSPLNKFELLLQQYNKKVEDIAFDYEGLTDEELEAAFAAAFDKETKEFDDPEPSGDDTDADDNGSDDSDDSDDENEEDEEETIIDDDPAPKKKVNNELTYSVEVNGQLKTFSVSLADKLKAIRDLVNNTYCEEDQVWYDVDVYEEDKTVVMHDYWNNKHYRQKYSVKQDVYSLKGDRVEVFAQYLTQDEINKLDNMKSNYEAVSEKLAKYEAEPEKIKILESDDYKNLAESEAFNELKVTEKHFDMSVEEVKQAADQMLLDFAKGNSIQYQPKNESVSKRNFQRVSSQNKSSRYGNLFED